MKKGEFREWLEREFPLGTRRMYLGRECVVTRHWWTNGFDASGDGLVMEYADNHGEIHESTYGPDGAIAFQRGSLDYP